MGDDERTLQLWTSGVGIPGSTPRQAAQAEAEGFDGFGVVDSQNLAGDPFVELAMAAQATTTILLGTAVTNPLTRHPAALATAIATVQANAGGRAVLGIGRGDSALAHLGLAPAPVTRFAHYLENLQGYLRGEELPFDTLVDAGDVRPSSSLGLAGGPRGSKLRWLRGDQPKVPVDVAASGPKVIATGASVAERVTFAVGIDLDRLRWAMEVAREARRARGLDDDGVAFGSYVPIFVHPDRAHARRCIAGGVASYARFSVMHGRVSGPVSAEDRSVLGEVHDRYDLNRHFSHGSPQSEALTDEVIDRFGIAGPPGCCIERIQELASLGLDKLFLMGAGFHLDAEEAKAGRRRLTEAVLPALR